MNKLENVRFFRSLITELRNVLASIGVAPLFVGSLPFLNWIYNFFGPNETFIRTMITNYIVNRSRLAEKLMRAHNYIQFRSMYSKPKST